ncbi:hypothetical protein SEVIR_7G090901v4 [Setaria viridis]
MWHTTLNDALWAYHMAYHGAIKVLPYQLVYGHEAVSPWEIKTGSRKIGNQDLVSADEYYGLMKDELEDLVHRWLIALERIEADKVRVVKYYNKKVVPKSFQEGELVWKTVLPIGTKDNKFGKWLLNWEGLYRVNRCVPGNA